MNFAMKLHYQLLATDSAALPVVLIHGLFGNLDNLGVLARDLNQQHSVIKVDLRNHGLSPRSAVMTYPEMAQDLLALLDELQLEKAIVIGHSMGGKAAMALTAIAPERVEKLIVIDVAPVDYRTRRHDEIFAALKAVSAAGITQRQQAAELMRSYLQEEGVIQFLLKSFHQGEWRFNLPVLIDQYENVTGWQDVPHGRTRRCLSAAACRPMCRTATAKISRVSSRRRERMWLPAQATGFTRKNRRRYCAPSTVFSTKPE
ncbi:Esterase ybfF [Serratia plymuthica]|uniref:Esterase ybfF n=1 Tax=Serratia plymuthica TaxID=82996 RepID=A0A2X4U413_SERPL|nr:Esterase ybfF [Serratia plymuthica]